MEKFIGTLIALKLVSTVQALTSVCDPNPCSPGGRCNTAASSLTNYTCSCYFGYLPAQQNTQCVDRDECSIGHHLCHNGTCINTQGSFHCKCNDGYTGSRCLEKANPCDSSPCLNGGKCTQTTKGYSCSCYNGFLQPNCQDRDECSIAHNLCHNGKCVNTPGSFRCDCNDGYLGSHCTIQSNPCSPSPCNNAKCTPISSFPGYKCSCYAGFIPPACTDRNECAMVANLCHNGTCVNTPGSFQCKCHNGFSGSHCTKPTDPCVSSPCLNGGKCSASALGHMCSCKPGYSLPNCIDKDECALVSNLCHNGSCVNTQGSFKCVCNKGYKGVHCTVQTLSTVTSTPVTMTDKLISSTASTYSPKNTVQSSTLSKQVPSTLQPKGQYSARLSNEDDTPYNMAWASVNWWVFVVAGAVVCVGAVTATVLVLKRRKKVYNKFDNAPSTPSSPTPITQENPLYMAIHGMKNDNTDSATSPKPLADKDTLYIDIHNNNQGDSEI